MRRLRGTLVPVCALIVLGCVGCGGENPPGPQPVDSVQIVFHQQEGTFDVLWGAFPGIGIQGATTGYFLGEGWVGVRDYPGGCTVSYGAGEHGGTVGTLHCPGQGVLPDLSLVIDADQGQGAALIRSRVENLTDRTFWLEGIEPLSCLAEKGCSAWVGPAPDQDVVFINAQASWGFSGAVKVRTGSLYKGAIGRALTLKQLLQLGNNVLSTPQVVQMALTGRDQLEAGVSWWTTAILDPGTGNAMIAGALDALNWKTAILLEYDPDEEMAQVGGPHAGGSFTELRAVCGLTGDRIPLGPGKTSSSELIRLAAEVSAIDGMQAYSREAAAQIPSRASINASRQPTMGWSTWSAYFSKVTEADVLKNAEFIGDRLAPFGYKLVQVDDGYETAWGDWRPNDKFPSGLKALCDRIKGMGLTPGVWIAPFMVNETLPVVKKHPDWFLRDTNGKPITYSQFPMAPVRPLDMTHPGAQRFVKRNLSTLYDAGFRLFKIDFLFGAAYEGLHHLPEYTGIATLRSALRLVRETLGEEVLFDVIQAPWLAAAETADFYRQSFDVEFVGIGRHWPFFEAEARGTVARYFSNNVLFRPDPDHTLLSGITIEEARTVVTYGALTGGIFWLSDKLAELPEDSIALITNQNILDIVKLQEPARPLDLFGEIDPYPYIFPILTWVAELFHLNRWTPDHPPRLWALSEQGGARVIGFFNWQKQASRTTWPMSDLGFDPGSNYVLEDLWTGEKGTIAGADGLTLDMPGHTTRLLRILRTG